MIDTTAAYLGEVGACGDMDSAVWGESLAEWADMFSWGFGLGPLDADLADAFEAAYPEDWAELSLDLVGGYIYTDVTGEADVYGFNYAQAFEMDADANIVVTDDGYLSAIAAADATYAVDAYYRSYWAFGFQL